jgi:hypothetical protein
VMEQFSITDPDCALRIYDARADAYLSSMEDSFRASTRVTGLDPVMVRRNANDYYLGQLEVADAYAQGADAFVLGNEWSRKALELGLDSLVPKSGTATFAVLEGLEGSVHAQSAVRYLNLASDGGFDALVLGVEGMRL